ncbi:MAG: chemotaxis-specific protein-glutamate methyltransferase CheB [Anaerolineae bacterium]|jgi:two-component system chemotaxis response regulator CheB|nr:chemotaxis-specific protein-glutamate methyltransferase CheB [Anaerolineae bacterium]
MTAPLSEKRQIRVLLAEDSATVRWHLSDVINKTAGLRVVGEARNGEEVLHLVPQLQPDVISMDINMPRLDGLAATRRLMIEHPLPVVIVSGLVEHDVELSFQALQAGALAVVEKPPDRNNPLFAEKQRQLVKTLIAMAGVKVIRRGRTSELPSLEIDMAHPFIAPRPSAPEIIAIGASAGGPSALSTLLKQLPHHLPVPIAIVQHMAHEFIPGLARWLEKSTGWQVRVVADNTVLEAGVVHLSPGTAHFAVTRRGKKLFAKLIAEQGHYRHQPAIDVLFSSVADTCGGAGVGVLMTGMGDDGAEGLFHLREAGGRTMAQDRASSIVFGMPAAAIKRGAVEEVIALNALAEVITKLF